MKLAGKQIQRTSHVSEPTEDLSRTTVDTHVCESGEESTEDD